MKRSRIRNKCNLPGKRVIEMKFLNKVNRSSWSAVHMKRIRKYFKGTLKYLHKGGNNLIDLAIVGEPTNECQIGDTIKIGRRGSINF
ncbi:MAG: hypothetical protein ACEY3E_06845, partial [Candidatus Tisiphia sp.]